MQARLIRLAVLGAPIVASIGFVALVSKVFPAPLDSFWLYLAWWAVLTGAATFVLVAVDRVARRLLPLAALFRLSLVFPDHAPSRFRAALASRSVGTLEESVAAAKAGMAGATPSRGGPATALARGSARYPRSAHPGPLGSRSRLFADDRRGDASRHRRGRSAQLGSPFARHREARCPDRDPRQGGQADRRRVGDPEAASRARRRSRRAAPLLARALDGGSHTAPRALGRQRLSGGHGRRGDRARGPHRRRCRRLRRHYVGEVRTRPPPTLSRDGRRSRGARARSSTPQSSERSSASRSDGSVSRWARCRGSRMRRCWGDSP